MGILFLILFLSFGINKELVNDVRWVTQSKEYQALCNQIYSIASEKLIDSIENDKNTNFAVILDLDETVLDNSQYQIELHERNESFNMDSWSKWVLREEANLVPGFYDYVQLLRKKNIQVIFLSNRMNARLTSTINNMKKLGVHSNSDVYLLRKNKTDKKHVRREEVFTSTGRMKDFPKLSIVQYLGDAMGDFYSSDYHRFGMDQFIFPNPMYGKW